VVGLEEDLFPNLMAVQSRADLEEERRLFYVAITRAEKRCTLSYAISRYKWGNLTASEPSRFIDEIDEKYLEMPKQNERAAWGGFGAARESARGVAPGTPPWARKATNDRPAADMESGKPVYGREKRAPLPQRPAPAQRSAPTPAPKPGNLKRIAADGKPLEATSSLGMDMPELAEGMTVEHERFGKGKVLKIEGHVPDLKATVFFPSAGQKQLLLRFAKLTVVEG
jgi:DNA helicase-2/ATP-dependent DNA helicase PcrA